jgi:hypothetical protein
MNFMPIKRKSVSILWQVRRNQHTAEDLVEKVLHMLVGQNLAGLDDLMKVGCTQ